MVLALNKNTLGNVFNLNFYSNNNSLVLDGYKKQTVLNSTSRGEFIAALAILRYQTIILLRSLSLYYRKRICMLMSAVRLIFELKSTVTMRHQFF